VLNKFDKILIVRDYKLNTEDSILIDNLPDLLRSDFSSWNDQLSVRTFFKQERAHKAPHFATITTDELLKKAKGLFGQGLQLIVANQIDPKDCCFRGCVWINEVGQYTTEVKFGSGTVRTVTNDCGYDLQVINAKPWESTGWPLIDRCVGKCMKTQLRNVIFEFSWYNVPVGYLKSNFVCWEITDDGTGLGMFREKV